MNLTLALAWFGLGASSVLLPVLLRSRAQARLERALRARLEALEAEAKDAQGPTHPLAAGDLVSDRYSVVRPIGAGSLGAVYEVARLSDGQALALKVVRCHASAAALQRFQREAQRAVQLTHPNLVSLIDLDLSRPGALTLVMELVPGRSLETERSRFGEPSWAMSTLAQLALGLEALHARGLAHRDLKPANVLVTREGLVKLADFGLASLGPQAGDPGFAATMELLAATAAGGGNLARSGLLVGTPKYMAPELAAGAGQTGPRADVFAFGVLAYEMLTRASPFPEAPLLARLHGRAAPEPVPLARSPRALDPEVVALVERCLLADPEARPPASELVRVFTAVRLPA